MKHLALCLCLSAVLLSASQSMAARCGGVAPPNYFVFCDDFDRYCNPVPTDPQEACNCQVDMPYQAAFEQVWVPLPKLCAGASAPHTLRSWYLHSTVDESWKCHSGSTQGYGARVYQADSTGVRVRRNERNMTAEILANPANTAGYGYVNGVGEISVPLNTDNTIPNDYVDSMSSTLRPGALKGQFKIKFYGAGHFANMVNYVELFADDDRAPFNYVMDYCTGEFMNNPRLLRNGDGQVHASFAIGVVAMYDNNVCDVDTGRLPTWYRIVCFDGLSWRHFQAPSFGIPLTSPADKADLYAADGWNHFSFSIGADYIEVRLSNTRSGAGFAAGEIPNNYWVARVPRQYKGGFNRMAIGPNHGLDMTTPACQWFNIGGVAQQLCNGGANNGLACATTDDCPVATEPCSVKIKAGADMLVDEFSLYDGAFVGAPAACCLPDMTCQILDSDGCAAEGGVFHTDVQSCDPSPCCPVPFADSNDDGDVDMDDFAALQRCLNIGLTPGTLGVGCGCFDTNGNNLIDAEDVENFADCGTGKDVQWAPTVDCPMP